MELTPTEDATLTRSEDKMAEVNREMAGFAADVRDLAADVRDLVDKAAANLAAVRELVEHLEARS